jgi:hypothetical protein
MSQGGCQEKISKKCQLFGMLPIIETSVLNDVEPLDIFRALSVKPLTSLVELPKARPP